MDKNFFAIFGSNFQLFPYFKRGQLPAPAPGQFAVFIIAHVPFIWLHLSAFLAFKLKTFTNTEGKISRLSGKLDNLQGV